MTDIEKNKLAMYESVLLFLFENKEIISNIKAFSWSINKLRKIIQEINLKEIVQTNAIFDNTIKTARAREELISALIPVANSLANFADSANYPELKHKANLTSNALNRMINSELAERADEIVLLTRRYLPRVRKPGVDSAVLKQIKVKTQKFSESLSNEEIHIFSNNLLLTISNLFADADKLLNSYMDNFVEVLSDEYPDFYDEYRLVRNIENQNMIKALLEIDEE